jgi:glutamate-ammonia-ligase adenylyltransferase
MQFADRMTRQPRAHDSDRGREAAEAVGLTGDLRALVEGMAGSSPYLATLVRRETDWLRTTLSATPEAALAELLETVPAIGYEAVGSGLRLAKRRLALLVALADLGGLWALDEVTGALTDFAIAATRRALEAALARERKRGRLPGESEADGMVVFAMGKMGARELNYSSDIDLVCLFDEERHAEAYAERRTAFVRATRGLAALLGEITAEGYVFRTDLRLRPDPSVTPVCLSMGAAESYYEALGRTWERAVWIKACPVAGDVPAGEAFLERLRPFVWRRHLDFVAIRDAHDMRLRIRDHKATHATGLEKRNVKLGPGGIREIEFFTQTRQLIAGGRDPNLRVRRTLDGLSRLADAGWVSRDDAVTLGDDYRFLREIEHRLQMIGDAQTHVLPGDAEGFARLAALAGRDVAGLRDELAACFERVAALTEDFFAPQTHETTLAVDDRAAMAKWRGYPALRSPRAVEIFERLAPSLFARVGRTADRERTLRHLEDFIGGLPAGVQLFALFEANPQLVDLVVDIADSAPELARYLGANAAVFDAVIGGRFFAPWPGTEALAGELRQRLARSDDYERQLDAARRWQKEWHFRVGVHMLRCLIDPEEAGRQYAALAEATIRVLWPAVVAEFAASHGAPPGNGAAVIGMGSLGAGLLTPSSDLDLIVVYDAEGDAASTGRRPLAARLYYARLTQALVTALSAPTAAGKLYEVDMRLRPSGRQGPVATSLAAFETYQREEAWTWEHLALTRARVVAGDAGPGAAVTRFLESLLGPARPPGPILGDTADMRRRLTDAHRDIGPWETKRGPGRTLDIELAAAASTLVAEGWPRNLHAQLDASGLFERDETEALADAHALLWSAQAAARLLGGGDPSPALAETPLFRRVTGETSPDAVAGVLEGRAAASARIIDRVFAPDRDGDGSAPGEA